MTPSDVMFELGVDRMESALAVGPEITTIPRVYRRAQSSVPSPFRPHLPLLDQRFGHHVYEAVTLTHPYPQLESHVSVKSLWYVQSVLPAIWVNGREEHLQHPHFW